MSTEQTDVHECHSCGSRIVIFKGNWDGRGKQVFIKLIHLVKWVEHSLLMSVLATCKKRDESFIDTVEGALKSEFTSEN